MTPTLRRQWQSILPAAIEKRYAEVKTIAQAVALPMDAAPCLLRMVRKSERKLIVAGLALHLRELDKFLALKNGMSDDALLFTAEGIIDEFGGSLTMADVKIVLTKAKRGGYGKMYERLDCPTVMEWFRQYHDERLSAAYEYNLNREARERREAQERDVETDKEMVAKLKAIVGGKKVEPLTEQERAEGYKEYLRWRQAFIEQGAATCEKA